MKKFDQYWPRANKTDPNAILYKIPASQTELLKDFQVRYFPSFYLIDPKGEISFRMVGWDPERLQAAFDLE